MNRYNWTNIPLEKLNPLFTRQVIHTPAKTIARLTLTKGNCLFAFCRQLSACLLICLPFLRSATLRNGILRSLLTVTGTGANKATLFDGSVRRATLSAVH